MLTNGGRNALAQTNSSTAISITMISRKGRNARALTSSSEASAAREPRKRENALTCFDLAEIVSSRKAIRLSVRDLPCVRYEPTTRAVSTQARAPRVERRHKGPHQCAR